jgi:hypothetical protein
MHAYEGTAPTFAAQVPRRCGPVLRRVEALELCGACALVRAKHQRLTEMGMMSIVPVSPVPGVLDHFSGKQLQAKACCYRR